MPDNEYNEPEPFFEEEGDDGENLELTPEELGQLEALAQVEETPEEQILPEELILSPLELLAVAITNNQHIQIEYTNRKGEFKQYVLEPYEIGGNNSHPAGYLWGWDTAADTIKSFFLSNISDVQLLETIFVSRF